MSQILVITTKDKVYTTLYKTIHGSDFFVTEKGKFQYQEEAQAHAFRLACTSFGASCKMVELDVYASDEDIFEFLEDWHKDGAGQATKNILEKLGNEGNKFLVHYTPIESGRRGEPRTMEVEASCKNDACKKASQEIEGHHSIKFATHIG